MADDPQVQAGAEQPAPAAAPTHPPVSLAGSEGNQPAYDAVSAKVFEQTRPGYFMSVVKQAFDTDTPIGLSEESAQHLRDAGIFNDYVKGQNDFIKTVNEAVLRPAATATDTIMRGLNAALVLPVGLAGAALDKMGVNPESPEANADHAQDFANYVYISSGFSAQEVPLAAQAIKGKVEPPMPPSVSAARDIPVATPKPWQAEIPQEETVAKTGVTTRPPDPPITNLPAPGSAEAEAKALVPKSAADNINHETPIIDGSGNLNLNYIRADQGVKDAMAKVAQGYAEKYGVEIPHAETEESAQAFMKEAMNQVTNGIPDVLGNYARGDAISRDMVWTARYLAVQTMNEAGGLSRIATQTGDEADLEAARQAVERATILTGPIRHEITAEPGRLLESFKIPVGIQLPMTADGAPVYTEEAMKKIADLKLSNPDMIKLLGSLDTPQAMAKFMADTQKPSFTDMGLYYVFNNYLSGPITHLAYAASWGVQTVIRAGIETPIASVIGKVQELAGKTLDPLEVNSLKEERATIMDRLAEADSRQGRKLTAVDRAPLEDRLKEIGDKLKNASTVMPHEAAARFYGIGEGALDSIRAFGRALKTGDVQMLPGEVQKAEAARQEATDAAIKKGADPKEALREGIAAYNRAATNFGNPIVEYGSMMKNPAGSATVKALGHVIGAPMRVIAAIHSLQKFSGYAESMNALAYRQAAEEGWTGTLRGVDALGQRIAQIKNNPSPEMMQQAADEAKYAALMGKSGKVGELFQNLANANAWTRVVVPFSKVVTNLTAQKVLERTPIGLLSSVVRGNIMGANGNAVQATQIAKMLTGSTLLTGGAYLAAQGINRGWGSDDKNDRAFAYLSGNAPYTVTIGDINLPHRFFGVAGGSLSLGADIYDINQVLDQNDEHWSNWEAVMGHAVHYMGRDILSENALTGPANLYNAINDEHKYQNFVANAIASSLVPYSTFQSQMTQRFIDPIMRSTTGDGDQYGRLMETIQSRTMFMSRDLMPKVDIFGNPMKHSDDPSWAEKDPVMQAFMQLGFHPAAVSSKLFGVNLNEKQLADYQTIAGKLLYNSLLPQTSNPNWVRLPSQTQAKILQDAVKASRAQALAAMASYYPELPKEGAQNKIDMLHQFDDDYNNE